MSLKTLLLVISSCGAQCAVEFGGALFVMAFDVVSQVTLGTKLLAAKLTNKALFQIGMYILHVTFQCHTVEELFGANITFNPD